MAMTLEQFVQVISEFDEELRRRDPVAFARAARNEGTLALLETHQDLRKRLHAKLDSWRPPEVKVKKGDWVTINGTRFRIGDVDVETGTVSIERVRVDGARVSGETGFSAEGLVADTTPPRDEELVSMAPRSARQQIIAHAVALAEPKTVDDVKPLTAEQLRVFLNFLQTTREARRAQLAKPSDSSDRTGYARWVDERHRQIAVLTELIALIEKHEPAEQHRKLRAALKAIRDSTNYESEDNYTAEYCERELDRVVAN